MRLASLFFDTHSAAFHLQETAKRRTRKELSRFAAMKIHLRNRSLAIAAFLFFLISSWLLFSQKNTTPSLRDEKTNLALRKAAHLLLTESGDSTTRIPPVRNVAQDVWQVEFPHSFDYDRLPKLLDSSLKEHGIGRSYDVAILTCKDMELTLGYNARDLNDAGEAPCTGGTMPEDCYILQVMFAAETQAGSKVLLALCLAGLFVSAFFMAKSLKKQSIQAPLQAVEPENGLIAIGQAQLSISNLTLISGNKRQQLTYREAKLLHLFATHPNQLLERSFILENVWQDEGIMVGRSVDVFVSRLRKLLQDDPTVRIVAVHGVGYRLETVTV